MENYTNMPEDKKGNVFTGFVGALIGGILGGVVWALAAVLTERVYAIIGLLIGVAAGYGYDLLKGPKGVTKLVCVLLAVVVGVAVGTFGSNGWWAHEVYVEQVGELSAQMRNALGIPSEKDYLIEMFTDSEVLPEVLKEFGTGLFFAALGCIGIFKDLAAKPQETVTGAAPSKDGSDDSDIASSL